MDKFWIVVAHRAGARIFSRNRPSEGLQFVEELEHPESRLTGQELDSDRPGKMFFSPSAGHLIHSLNAASTSHESEAIRFSQEVARRLQTARSQNKFDKLLLVAGPEELGLLRRSLDKQTNGRVLMTLNKNLSNVRDIDIEGALEAMLLGAEEKITYSP